MTTEWYELLSLFMRYVFALLGLLIVWRVYRWILRDAKQYDREMRRLPDAGLVGEVVDIESGKAYPLPREGMIGSSRGCDICLRRRDIAARHATFLFEDGKGLRVTPYRRHSLSLDDTELRGAAHALHGSVLALGRCLLRVRLFAGLDVPHPSTFARDAECAETDTEDVAPDYQTPSPYMPADNEEAAYQTQYVLPQPGQRAADLREQMQMTWPYAVLPPDMAKSVPTQASRDIPDALYPDMALPHQGQPEAAYDRNGVTPNIANEAPPSEDDETPTYQSPMPKRNRRRDRR